MAESKMKFRQTASIKIIRAGLNAENNEGSLEPVTCNHCGGMIGRDSKCVSCGQSKQQVLEES